MENVSAHNNRLNNAKYILIYLVVLGHLIAPIIQDDTILRTLYLFIYSFHMPAFVMISGMLSSKDPSRNTHRILIKKLLIPFAVFTVIYELNHLFLFKTPSDYVLNLIPHWVLWYLLSLYIWRVTLAKFIKFKAIIYLSILASLALGLLTEFGNTYGLSRTIYFWPFFLIGHFLGKDFHKFYLFKQSLKPFWVIALALTITALYFHNELNRFLFYGSKSYAQLGLSPSEGLISRGFIYLLSLLNAFAVLALMPNKLSVPSHWKTNSLYIYLWHGLIIKIFITAGVITLIGETHHIVRYSLIIITSLLITMAFASNFAARKTETYLFEPFRKFLG